MQVDEGADIGLELPDGSVNASVATAALGGLFCRARTNGVCERGSFSAGGLFSYGPYVPDMYRRAADLVDKIVRGAKPGEISVEHPLARADEVIE